MPYNNLSKYSMGGIIIINPGSHTQQKKKKKKGQKGECSIKQNKYAKPSLAPFDAAPVVCLSLNPIPFECPMQTTIFPLPIFNQIYMSIYDPYPFLSPPPSSPSTSSTPQPLKLPSS